MVPSFISSRCTAAALTPSMRASSPTVAEPSMRSTRFSSRAARGAADLSVDGRVAPAPPRRGRGARLDRHRAAREAARGGLAGEVLLLAQVHHLAHALALLGGALGGFRGGRGRTAGSGRATALLVGLDRLLGDQRLGRRLGGGDRLGDRLRLRDRRRRGGRGRGRSRLGRHRRRRPAAGTTAAAARPARPRARGRPSCAAGSPPSRCRRLRVAR